MSIGWSVFLLSLLGLVPHSGGYGVTGVYVYSGNPFQPGPLTVSNVTLNKASDGIPEHTQVFFPTTPGTYAPVLFVPGVFTFVVTELYSTVLAHFASYGYIVFGVDLFWPLAGQAKWREQSRESAPEEHEYEKMFDVINWLASNLNQHVLPSHGAANVVADWGDLGVMSHSLGADYLVQMLQNNKTFAKAAAFLEPASIHFSKPFGFPIPALSYGTQLCSESPACCTMDFGYFHFYDELVCPRILMNVTGYGHCDILNEDGWKACSVVHFCRTDPNNNRDLYRNQFVPGVVASFFGDYLQGNEGMVKYITTRDLMPVPVGQLYVNINCTTTL